MDDEYPVRRDSSGSIADVQMPGAGVASVSRTALHYLLQVSYHFQCGYRGNTFSRSHTFLRDTQPRFWNFAVVSRSLAC